MSSSKKIDDGGPAFQVFHQHALGRMENDNNGMSLRDWFAGQALNAIMEPMMKAGFKDRIHPVDQATNMAAAAYVMADAMIAARKAGAA